MECFRYYNLWGNFLFFKVLVVICISSFEMHKLVCLTFNVLNSNLNLIKILIKLSMLLMCSPNPFKIEFTLET